MIVCFHSSRTLFKYISTNTSLRVGLLCVVPSRDGVSVRDWEQWVWERKWLDEPMLSCSHGRPGRNRDICRGRSRVGLDSPWMLWMLLHMDFNETELRA